MTVTLNKIVLAIRDLAADQPDFRYKDFQRKLDRGRGLKPRQDKDIACVYVDDDNCPSCIVACAIYQVADNEGCEDRWLNIMSENEGMNAYTLLSSYDSSEDHKLRLWIGAVQANQDDNKTWADAITYADAAYKLK